MNVVARVFQLRNFLSQQLHSADRIAENDGLVDLQFFEQCIQALHFALLFQESVVLGDT